MSGEMKIYLVGGAVRDKLLDLEVKDRDWVVVGATEQVMLDQGFRRNDANFPVFLHPETGEEYALARREIKTGPGYKGFEVSAGPDVTLEEDLIRRDLTINAIAEDQQGNIVDPFAGRDDLDNGLLRHISPAFEEDPVRLLRIARFAAKLGQWGFRVSHSTHALMKKMALSDDLNALKRERIWQELKRSLSEAQPWRFFEVLHRTLVLERIIPEMVSEMGEVDSHSSDQSSRSMEALKAGCRLSKSVEVRFCCASYYAAQHARNKGFNLPLEKSYRELLELTLDLGSSFNQLAGAAPEDLLRFMERAHAEKQPDRFRRLLEACAALWPDQAEAIRRTLSSALDAVGRVSSESLRSKGLEGRALGQALRDMRLKAIAEALAQ